MKGLAVLLGVIWVCTFGCGDGQNSTPDDSQDTGEEGLPLLFADPDADPADHHLSAQSP